MLMQEKTVATVEPETDSKQEPEYEQYIEVPYGTEEMEDSDEDYVAEEETVAGILEKSSPGKSQETPTKQDKETEVKELDIEQMTEEDIEYELGHLQLEMDKLLRRFSLQQALKGKLVQRKNQLKEKRQFKKVLSNLKE